MYIVTLQGRQKTFRARTGNSLPFRLSPHPHRPHPLLLLQNTETGLAAAMTRNSISLIRGNSCVPLI
jgi:hypothetical protein